MLLLLLLFFVVVVAVALWWHGHGLQAARTVGKATRRPSPNGAPQPRKLHHWGTMCAGDKAFRINCGNIHVCLPSLPGAPPRPPAQPVTSHSLNMGMLECSAHSFECLHVHHRRALAHHDRPVPTDTTGAQELRHDRRVPHRAQDQCHPPFHRWSNVADDAKPDWMPSTTL